MRSAWAIYLGAIVASLAVSIVVADAAEVCDLPALAKAVRPSVMTLTVYDAGGREIGKGTGFVVSADGKLVTNRHVVEGAARVVAKSQSGGTFAVLGIVADDAKSDLAILQLDGKDLPALTLGSSELIVVGTRIAVVGSPLGLEGTLSEGIVSAVREVPGSDWRLLQMSAPISPGSSGSPVVNEKGEVIGVAFALAKEGQSVNFAIPVEKVKSLLADCTKKPVKPYAVAKPAETGQGNFWEDPDWEAAFTAQLASNYPELLLRAEAMVRRSPDDKWANSMLASAYEGLKRWDDAIAIRKRAIAKAPEDAKAWIDLGDCYKAMGRTDDALASFKRAEAIEPKSLLMWLLLGMSYQGMGRNGDALEAFQRITQAWPDLELGWCYLGKSLRAMGECDKAVAAYEKAIALSPTSAEAWAGLGNASQFSKEYKEKTVPACRRALELDPGSASAWRTLYYYYGMGGDLKEAEKAWEGLRSVVGDLAYSERDLFKLDGPQPPEQEAYRRDPDYRLLLNALIAEDKIKALKLAQALVAKHPNCHEAHYLLAAAFKVLDFYDEAIVEYKEAVKVKPDCVDAWGDLGDAYRKAKRYEESFGAFNQAVKLRPLSEGLWINFGRAYEEDHRYQDAIKAYKEAVKARPSDELSWRFLGGAYTLAEQWQEAIGAYKQAVKLKPMLSDAWFNLGICYYNTAQFSDGIDAFQRALRLDSRQGETWFNLCRCYVKNGEREKARGVWLKLRELDPVMASKLRGFFE